MGENASLTFASSSAETRSNLNFRRMGVSLSLPQGGAITGGLRCQPRPSSLTPRPSHVAPGHAPAPGPAPGPQTPPHAPAQVHPPRFPRSGPDRTCRPPRLFQVKMEPGYPLSAKSSSWIMPTAGREPLYPSLLPPAPFPATTESTAPFSTRAQAPRLDGSS